MADSPSLTPVLGDPFSGPTLTPVEGDPFQQNMAVTDYARELPNVAAQPALGQPGGAPLDDFTPAPQGLAPQPAIPALAGVAGDPSRSMAVRIPAAIGSSLADQGLGLAKSAWGGATLPGDVARGLVDPNSQEAIRRSTDLAGMLTLPAAGGEFNPDVMNAGPITAYHGSPHSFDQFDLSKIGTGEGAQAYGHGLYFAGNEDVAKSYRDTLAPSRAKLPEDVSALAPDMRSAIVVHAGSDADSMTAARRAQYMSSSLRNVPQENVADMIDRIRSAKTGSMYQVAINADPEHFLDWDKPLSEQHPVVQQAVAALSGAGDLNKPLFSSVATGRDFHTNLVNSLPIPEGGLPEMQGSAAKALRDAGVPGIRYLDAGSRAAGDGSSNYVVFDDKTISVLKKYGLAGLGIGAGGAALMGQDRPAQASGFRLTPVQGNPFTSAADVAEQARVKP